MGVTFRRRRADRRREMVTAIILLEVRRDAINETAQALLKLGGVAEVYSIAGAWDLAVIARVAKNDELADLVTNHMLKLAGITKTTTLIAFRAYSRHDLERMFPIGME
jgi:DNA-binding Lrp family transcriptional regulator